MASRPGTIAQLFPAQGTLERAGISGLDTNRLVEFSHGFVEFLPMPTLTHQLIAMLSLSPPGIVRVRRNSLGDCSVPAALQGAALGREVSRARRVFMRAEHASRMGEQFWEGADLVMEVVSDGTKPHRDLVTKREEYAQAGIPEYWIVDPELGQITVLTLDGTSYAVHGEFTRGEQATSKLLPGFAVDVTSALAAKR